VTGPAHPFTHEGVPIRIVFGVGVRHGVAEELDRLGLSQVVLIASESSRDEANAMAAALDHRLTWRVDGVRQHVPTELAQEVTDDAIRVGADGVVTLGGGSATGLGKAVAVSGLPLVAVPTTYSGSEMTPFWGVTTGRHKEVGRDLSVVPKTVLYDPELTYRLPAHITAASGMNALAHCLEGLWAAGASPLTEPVALDAARALCGSLPVAVAEPWDAKARGRALVGACQAGMVLAGAGTGLHHKLCHVLGGRYDMPHAQTHAALLPHVVGFNEAVLGSLAARMAVAVGSGRASTAVYHLAVHMGLTMALGELGMPEEGIAEVAAEVAAAPPPNPRPVDEASLRSLLRAAWEGDGPG
jgi:maleylacetate reductase